MFLSDEEDDVLDTAAWAASLKSQPPKKQRKTDKPVPAVASGDPDEIELPEGFDLQSEIKKANIDVNDIHVNEEGGVKKIKVLNKDTGGPDIEADEEHVTFAKRRVPRRQMRVVQPVLEQAPQPRSWKTVELAPEEEEKEIEEELNVLKRLGPAPQPEVVINEIDTEMAETVKSSNVGGEKMSHRRNALTSTAEFAQSLATPIEKIEEERSTLEAIRRRIRQPDEEIVTQSLKETTDFEASVLGEAPLDGGMKSALDYLKRKGELKSEVVEEVKVDYTDDYDQSLNPKEAFRYLSWHFHGKGPGAKKMEKRLKKLKTS